MLSRIGILVLFVFAAVVACDQQCPDEVEDEEVTYPMPGNVTCDDFRTCSYSCDSDTRDFEARVRCIEDRCTRPRDLPPDAALNFGVTCAYINIGPYNADTCDEYYEQCREVAGEN